MCMRGRIVTVGLALGLCAFGATPASATGESWSYRECGLSTVNPADDDRWVGVLDAAILVASPTHNNAVGATVTCEIRIDGVPAARVSGSGTTLVTFASPVEYHAEITDVVGVCTTVDYTSDPTPTTVDCNYGTTTQFPPQSWIDLVEYVVGVALAVATYADIPACAAFQAMAPGTGPVAITPEGDVSVDGEPWYDCPPYVNPVPSAEPYPPLPGFDPHTPVTGPTGGGYDNGDVGFLALVSPETTTLRMPPADPVEADDVASACAFRVDRANGTVTVLGGTASRLADSVAIHCQLRDATTDAVVYDHTETANAPVVSWHDTVPAPSGALTVCTEGTGVWGTRTVTVGPYCRPGEEI